MIGLVYSRSSAKNTTDRIIIHGRERWWPTSSWWTVLGPAGFTQAALAEWRGRMRFAPASLVEPTARKVRDTPKRSTEPDELD